MNWREVLNALPKIPGPSTTAPSGEPAPIEPRRAEDEAPDPYAEMDREERRLRAVERAAKARRTSPP